MTENGRVEISEGYGDLMESTALLHVATLGPDGEPQNNPVWFSWDGGHIKFSQTKARQKYRNVNREPRVALSILDPETVFINALAKKYMGRDVHPFHRAGDERVVVYVRPGHTTQMGA